MLCLTSGDYKGLARSSAFACQAYYYDIQAV